MEKQGNVVVEVVPNKVYRVGTRQVYLIRVDKDNLIKKKDKPTDRTIYQLKPGVLQ